jgi:hypothetical protein
VRDADEGGRRAARDDGRREGIWCVGPTKLMGGTLNYVGEEILVSKSWGMGD